MVGIPADGVRLGMGPPVELVFWHALEHFAGVSHLLIELGQNRLSVRHHFLVWGRAICKFSFPRSAWERAAWTLCVLLSTQSVGNRVPTETVGTRSFVVVRYSCLRV